MCAKEIALHIVTFHHIMGPKWHYILSSDYTGSQISPKSAREKYPFLILMIRLYKLIHVYAKPQTYSWYKWYIYRHVQVGRVSCVLPVCKYKQYKIKTNCHPDFVIYAFFTVSKDDIFMQIWLNKQYSIVVLKFLIKPTKINKTLCFDEIKIFF